MQMHVFRSYVLPTPAQLNAAADECAELMSRDYPLRKIARRMEVSVGTVCVLWRMIGERVGEMPR